MSETIDQYWAAFCSHRAVDTGTPFQVWYFGDSPEMARDLAHLVVAGRKTATASLARTNELIPENAPVIGDLSVVTDFDGEPICVIRTTEIGLFPFHEVGPGFAASEGEGDLSLEYWRRVHRDYFTREAEDLGFEFDEDSIVCCEMFKLEMGSLPQSELPKG